MTQNTPSQAAVNYIQLGKKKTRKVIKLHSNETPEWNTHGMPVMVSLTWLQHLLNFQLVHVVVDESAVLHKCAKVIQKSAVYTDTETVHALSVKHLVAIIVSQVSRALEGSEKIVQNSKAEMANRKYDLKRISRRK